MISLESRYPKFSVWFFIEFINIVLDSAVLSNIMSWLKFLYSIENPH